MPRRIAFLRAINVGGHVVKMDQLRKIFTSFGFGDVETFIASGNVIFSATSTSAAKVEDRIEEGLIAELGYEVKTMVRTPKELADIVTHRPFDLDVSVVGFLKNAPKQDAVKAALAWDIGDEEIAIRGKELYWRHGGRMSESALGKIQIERTLGPLTMRNLSTVAKIAAKHPA
ncbi:MAG TPA: DUF1697 domain-containing protein [Acidimicrobiales bacterium]|nr:DUF1697 domain-containing protein [Acidimicrobiales bacterium]